MKKGSILRIKIQCQKCEKIFKVFPYRKKTAKYCSRRCFDLSKKGVFKKITEERECFNCNNVFEISIGDNEQIKRKYCNLKCYRIKRSSGYYQSRENAYTVKLHIMEEERKEIFVLKNVFINGLLGK